MGSNIRRRKVNNRAASNAVSYFKYPSANFARHAVARRFARYGLAYSATRLAYDFLHFFFPRTQPAFEWQN